MVQRLSGQYAGMRWVMSTVTCMPANPLVVFNASVRWFPSISASGLPGRRRIVIASSSGLGSQPRVPLRDRRIRDTSLGLDCKIEGKGKSLTAILVSSSVGRLSILDTTQILEVGNDKGEERGTCGNRSGDRKDQADCLAFLDEGVSDALLSLGARVLRHDVSSLSLSRLFRPHVSSMAYSVTGCKSYRKVRAGHFER
jgi:hypothetical protein